MDSIQVQSFSTSCNAFFVFTCTLFSVFTFLQVSFSIPYAVTQQFCKLSSMFSFFPSVTFESFSYFRITFAVCLTAHSQIHTYFSTFTHEVIVQILDHFFVTTFCNTDNVFVSKRQCATFYFNNFYELAGRSFTQWTFLRSCVTFMNVTAYSTSKFLHFLLNFKLISQYVFLYLYLSNSCKYLYNNNELPIPDDHPFPNFPLV